jgi:lysophospholipase L1-like esterase
MSTSFVGRALLASNCWFLCSGLLIGQATTTPAKPKEAIKETPKSEEKAPAKSDEKAAPAADKWEASIAKIEDNLTKQKPAADRWVFTGSSSITKWKLDKSFPQHNVLNHGFGGSQMSDVVRYFDRIVTPAKPAIVVLYSGDNDLGAKKSPEQITADTRKIVEMLKRDLPQTRLVVIGVKPSIKRWALRDKQIETNDLLKKLIAEQKSPLYEFIDLGPVLLDSEGQPDKANYVEDGLHMTDAGYAKWVEKLLPVLLKTPSK